MSSALPKRQLQVDLGHREVGPVSDREKQQEQLVQCSEALRELALVLAQSAPPAATTWTLPLQTLQQRLRGDLDSEQLQASLRELHSLLPVQAQAVGSGGQGAKKLIASLGQLLEGIDFDPRLRQQAHNLKAALAYLKPEDDLGRVMLAIAELVNQQSSSLQEALSRFQKMFGQINVRLGHMFRHVAEDKQAFEAAQESGKALEQQLLSEVSDLGQAVRQADELELLQNQVDQRMRKIEKHLDAFRRREHGQSELFRQRAEQMRQRITELEQQAQFLEQAMQEQRRRALIDPLTGIANRQAYHRRLAELAASSPRPLLTMAVWDIDRFKQINDNFGHKAGDRALRLVAQRLQSTLRPEDFLARFGGEEFIMLLMDVHLPEAIPILESIRQTIAGTGFHHGQEPVRLTMSCGASELRRGEDLDTAFERADGALYEAKRSGRNRISSA